MIIIELVIAIALIVSGVMLFMKNKKKTVDEVIEEVENLTRDDLDTLEALKLLKQSVYSLDSDLTLDKITKTEYDNAMKVVDETLRRVEEKYGEKANRTASGQDIPILEEE